MGEKDENSIFLKNSDGEYWPLTGIAEIPENVEPDQNDNLPNFSEAGSVTINFKLNSNTKKILFWTIVAPDKISRNNFRKNHGIPMMRRVAGRKGARKREKQYAFI